MKKSIVLFLLIVAGAFQIAWGQEEDPYSNITNPCGGTTQKMQYHASLVPEGCPGCRINYFAVYSVVDQMPSFEISELFVTDECYKCFNTQKL